MIDCAKYVDIKRKMMEGEKFVAHQKKPARHAGMMPLLISKKMFWDTNVLQTQLDNEYNETSLYRSFNIKSMFA